MRKNRPDSADGRQTKAQILERTEREKVKFLRLQFTDILEGGNPFPRGNTWSDGDEDGVHREKRRIPAVGGRSLFRRSI